MIIGPLYAKLLRSLGPTRLSDLLLKLEEGNSYVLVGEFGLNRAELSLVRMNATPLLTYHIKEGQSVLETLLAA